MEIRSIVRVVIMIAVMLGFIQLQIKHAVSHFDEKLFQESTKPTVAQEHNYSKIPTAENRRN